MARLYFTLFGKMELLIKTGLKIYLTKIGSFPSSNILQKIRDYDLSVRVINSMGGQLEIYV